MIVYPDECRLSEPLVFDTHAHYDDERFDECRNELLTSLFENGVCGIITCGCNQESSKVAIELAEKYENVYAAVGIHPCDAGKGTEVSDIAALASHPKCVAIGEIGLDYYWEPYDKELEKKVFCEQIELAQSMELPILVHDREAHADTLEILKKYRPKGVVHCYSGSPEMAAEIIKLGMYIGVGGVITFKNAKRLPETVALIPEDKLLLETDAPYLAPMPYRSKTCHSGLIPLAAQKIAEIRGTTSEEVLKLTRQNAEKLFGIK